MRFVYTAFLLAAGGLLGSGTAAADASRYPEVAQQRPENVAAEFIGLDQLVEWILEKKGPVIVDVRTAEEYEEAHIKGSVSIPLGEIPRRLAEIPKDRPVILY